MAETFRNELQALIESAKQPGPMYNGWQNPLVDPNEKGPNGVYATPFDRQGGPAVAEAEMRTQIAGALSKFVGTNYDQSAIDEILRIIKGEGQSPAVHGGNSDAISPYTQTSYGANLSAPAQNPAPAAMSTPPISAPTSGATQIPGVSPALAMRLEAFFAAEDEKQRKEKEDKEREEEDRKRKEEMSAIADVIKTSVAAAVDARFAQYGFTAPQQMSTPAPQTDPGYSNPMGGNAGLAMGGNPVAPQGGVQSLPGVQMPMGMGVPANNAMVQTPETPEQQRANAFLEMAMAATSQMQDEGDRNAMRAEMRELYTGVAMGLPVNINHPHLRKLAKEAGIIVQDLGGVR